ncbi:hypothetical protein A2U01_0034082, partial [Trifolium medium]|nr:hypothetical protein [Trifolium medium]
DIIQLSYHVHQTDPNWTGMDDHTISTMSSTFNMFGSSQARAPPSACKAQPNLQNAQLRSNRLPLRFPVGPVRPAGVQKK